MSQVREIILYGWSENFSTKGPEHCHLEFCTNLAGFTNNKDLFLTILRWHVRAAHLMQPMTVLMNSVQLLDLRLIRMMEYLVSWAFVIRPCKL